jgi:archaellum component FlaD/FlaE
MEIGSIFPSSDNLYKFLFMGGIIMIVFSFVYPLEKKQKIELEINLYNREVEVLNTEINELNDEVSKLKDKTKDSKKSLNNQNKIKDRKLAERKIEDIKKEYNKAYNETKNKQNEINTKNIVLKYEKKKIQLLQSQVGSFTVFRWLFLILGIIFTIFGICKWYNSSCILEKLQKLELKKIEKETL